MHEPFSDESSTDKQVPERRYVQFDVSGKDQLLWQKLRPKLIQALSDFLDTVVDYEKGSTIREEAKKISTALLNHAKARLAHAGYENEKLEAEVEYLYAQAEREYAEARKQRAEASALEFATSVRKLRLILGGTKAMLVGDTGREALLVGQQIDAFLQVVSEMEMK